MSSREEPRPEKVALVEEIKGHLESANAVVVTEYRGLNVPQQAELRSAVRAAGGEVKIYKNTLTRRAAADAGLDFGDMLVGPTALAFVTPDADGNPGDPAALAKALADFGDANPAFVFKGGLMDGAPLDEAAVKALSKLPSKDVMLAQFAGLLQAPMAKMAALLQAPMREMAGLIKALEEKGGAGDAPASSDASSDAEDAPAEEAPADAAEEGTEPQDAVDAPAGDDAADETGSDEAAEGE